MGSEWKSTSCALCGRTEGQTLLEIPHPDAPRGASRVLRCGSCGLRRLDPRPGEEALARYYGSNYSAFVGRSRGAAKQAVWDFLRDVSSGTRGRGRRAPLLAPLIRPFAEWLFDINIPLNAPTPPRVLDVGCGYGDLLIYLKSRGCEVLGVDLDERAAEQAGGMHVPIRIGPLPRLNLAPASFDVAILCHSLEHMSDPDAALGELARLLKPGGCLHIAVPNGNAVGLRLDGLAWAHLSHPLHFWFFDAGNLAALLRRHQFTPTKLPYSTSRHHYLSRWWQQIGTEGFWRASQRLGRHLHTAATTRDGGDVLRMVARLLP